MKHLNFNKGDISGLTICGILRRYCPVEEAGGVIETVRVVNISKKLIMSGRPIMLILKR